MMRTKRKGRQESRNGRRLQNRPVLAITYGVCAVFIGLIAWLLYFVILEAPLVIGNTYNPRVDLMAERVVRGEIVSADGQTLARTDRDQEGTETRVYPYGSLFAPVTGYMQKGKTGVESLGNFYLLSSHVNILERTLNDLTGQKSVGDDLWLTIDSELQQTASEALGDRRGAVMAMDPETGRILCMVSKPSFDPNTIAADWDNLTDPDNDQGQLLNRAAQGAYPPGSTFKILTVLAYIHENPDSWQSFRFNCTGSYTDSEGNTIRCYGGEAHGEQSLEQAFANSCNGAFAQIGGELSVSGFQSLAESLLFNKELPYSLPYTKSRFRLSETDSLFVREQTAIGQGETTMSPLHSLLLVSALAKDGELMQPMILDHLENGGGETFRSFHPQRFGRLFSQEDTELLRQMMRKTVTEGTGSAFRDAAYEAYAKTGSAEYQSQEGMKTHAWCSAFAEHNGRSIAVCVLAEDGKSGGSTAAPVARAVMDAWLLQQG